MIGDGFEGPENSEVRAAAGRLRVRVGQPIEGSTADDAEPRDRGFTLDVIVGAQRVDERTNFCR